MILVRLWIVCRKDESKLPMSFDNPFDVTGAPSSLPPLPASPERMTPSPLEILLLLCIVIDIITVAILSSVAQPSAWIIGYLLSVVAGVTLLGSYTQTVFHRFTRLRIAVTGRAKALRFILVIGLVAPALVCATRLAVEWSS